MTDPYEVVGQLSGMTCKNGVYYDIHGNDAIVIISKNAIYLPNELGGLSGKLFVRGIYNTEFSFTDFECTELDVSELDTSGITDMTELFSFMPYLRKITFGDKFDTSSVTDMSCMFIHCPNLTEIDLSTFKTPNLAITRSMFHGCHGLETVDLSSFDFTKIKNTSKMFCDCLSLTDVNLGTYKHDAKNIYATGMFANCPELRTIKCIPETETAFKDGKTYVDIHFNETDDNDYDY